MKKALLLTNCSIDQALALGQWLENTTEPVRLTVVHAYDPTPEAGQSLKAATHRVAKQEANGKLNRWLSFLPGSCLSTIQTTTLAGNTNLVARIHLLLRRYDYLLLDGSQANVRLAYMACQRQITTELRVIGPGEQDVICTPDGCAGGGRLAGVPL